MLSLILPSLLALAQGAPHGHPKGNSTGLNAGLVSDLAVAKAFAAHITGPSNVTANWTAAGDDLSLWDGFFLETNPDTNQLALASVDINGFGLEGDYQLEGFLDKLHDLALFHANSNNFKGTIPKINKLKYLYELDVSNNKLSGSFPKNALGVNGLTFFDIRFNSFSGKLPSDLFTTWPQIEAIFVNNNEFEGEIPNSIGAFPGQYLALANNKLSGAIPTTVANMASLQEFLLLGNQLTGTIPQGLGNLVNLTVFDASHNQLTGPVPEDLCASKSVQNITLEGNNLDKNLGPNCAQALKKGVLTI
ncbi:Leucine-rich repeat LRR protein [Pyrenophora tritici-repentis]|uniref:Leucine rich repeat protein n=2 Tax=Pyrenophora tritici-repentis TaxID=45151 RepID=A0A2W1DLG6_9PLEO|nr:leucine rich repeat protein [Pyrenophora tritici-repentis Pt-1C-BFP]KAA8613894.1 leucine rich repeat protein [Pyrenophora tritici-repentis]EDU49705.1 leucine rich repeat protein [Pyrenophora tritici-repentis Pt-1C-BFP]KAF7445613.1 leucine rich repeat protein [Pyrenophora tritici-repentis]KAF7565886.1 Leucine-rich repeat (LRR) protein [Pyrenophora tritici-repentis]KAG9380012.1 leucine rich repeat protein [Pyrenophora tritici-repentis]